MIDKVFVFGDKDVADVMVPRPEVVAVSVELPPEQALAAVLDSPYTRYPVYRESLDDIIGVLHVRDLFTAMHDRGLAVGAARGDRAPGVHRPRDEGSRLAAAGVPARRTTTSPSSSTSTAAWRASARSRTCSRRSSARSRTSSTCPRSQIEQIDDDTYRIDGMFPIDEFNERFGTDLPDDDYHTLGGFVFGQLGRAPEPGDDVS